MLEKIFEEEQENNEINIFKYLVVACTKLFFKRAPEMHSILSRIYKYVMLQSHDADLKQRITFYYKLM
jgi:hypothetical protein